MYLFISNMIAVFTLIRKMVQNKNVSITTNNKTTEKNVKLLCVILISRTHSIQWNSKGSVVVVVKSGCRQ